MSKEKERRPLPSRKREMPATVGFIDEVRYELKADIKSVDVKVDQLRNELKADIQAVDHKVDKVRDDLRSLDQKVDLFRNELKADIKKSSLDVMISVQEMKAAMHRTQALTEQQHSENRLVLEALTGLSQRQDRLEKRQDENDLTIKEIAKWARSAQKGRSS